MEDNSILLLESPIFNPEAIIVRDEGELPKGIYYYVVTTVVKNKEITSYRILQVYAKYKNNSVILSWLPVKDIFEYRVYRGTDPNNFDGYFSIFSSEYFCDDGRGILNEAKLNPPMYGN